MEKDTVAEFASVPHVPTTSAVAGVCCMCGITGRVLCFAS